MTGAGPEGWLEISMKPETIHKRLSLILASLAFGVLSACGDGGGGIGIADGGIRGTGSSVGPVSGFGSVFVNGVKFETDGNVVSNDGLTSETQLEKGMILRVEGEWKTDGQGTADAVEYDDTFRGRVSGVQVILGADGRVERVNFTVYGQQITADRLTVFRQLTLETLVNGTFVRISAWQLDGGSYRASYVGQIVPDESDVEIEGRITGSFTDVGLNRFRLNGFLIEYDDDNTEFLGGLSESDLATEGLSIEVEGEVIEIDGQPAIQARTIRPDDTRRYQRGEADDIEFVGPVATSFNLSDRTFEINGLTVFVPDEDVFEDGLTGNDLHPGLLIQVEGKFRSDGSVEAEEIELRESNAEVEGVIEPGAIDFNARTFRLGGVLVQVTPQTIIADDDDDRRITLADLNGRYELQVDGIERSGPSDKVFLEVLKIERDHDDEGGSDYEMTGRLGDINCSTFITVLGVRMDITHETGFDDVSCATLESDFRDRGLRPLLEVEYVKRADGTFWAAEIELEDD